METSTPFMIEAYLESFRNTSMLAKSASTTKLSACFICGQEIPLSELTTHEKACLDTIKANDTQYTRQSGDDGSSDHSFPTAYSNLSTHSSSSGDSAGTEKKYSQCYICGTDVPSYLASIHEKNCKKSWETGLLNSICTPARKSKSKTDVSTLSRSSSRDNILQKQNDFSLSTPNLTKAKSTTNLQNAKMTPTKSDKPRHLRSNGRKSTSPMSRSTTNLSTKTTSKDSLLSSTENLSKSSQDVRDVTDAPKRRNTGDPQYVICQICGKLYSKHSISIHQRSCEKMYQKQKSVGTNVDYKVKSRSLVDLTKTNSRRTPIPTSKPKSERRPASANPINKIKTNSLSRSTGNLAPTSTYRRRLLTSNKKTVVNGETTNESSMASPISKSEIDISTTSPGLRKCYLCRQLYGTRSLPIHEKQCLKKWERAQEDERKQRKSNARTAKQQDIQVSSFGRTKFEEENGLNSKSESDQEENYDLESTTIQKPIISPSKIFGVPSPLKKGFTGPDTDDSLDEADGKASTLDNDKNNGKVLTNGEPGPERRKSGSGPKFVVCIYCSKQFGQHSISIHEKSCREKMKIETKTKERMATQSKIKNNKKLSQSVGDMTLSDAFDVTTNDMLQLVKCNECLRKFLKSDIEKHKIHCRVSVL
ncbi:zinc finger protein 474-like isoform X2 [Clytia hemisphaerica]|uniref:Zinc finger protein n=1 Tax=Clytia hemisphaerica TaxID=252671 RepID=A0A7M5WUD4_9CNID